MSRQQVNSPIQQFAVSTPASPPSGSLMLYPKSDGNFYKLTSGGVETIVGGGGGGLTLPLSQHLTFSPDSTYDIGASGANRPRDLFLGRNVTIGNVAASSMMTFLGPDPSSIGLPLISLRVGVMPDTSYALELIDRGSLVTQLALTPGATGLYSSLRLSNSPDIFNSTYIQINSDGGVFLGNEGTGAPATFTLDMGGPIIVRNAGVAFPLNLYYDVSVGEDQASHSRPFSLSMAITTTPPNAAAGFVRLYPKADNNFYKLDASGVETMLGGGGLTLPLSQNLTFSPDNTYDIGASQSANRPRNLFLGGSAGIAGTASVCYPAGMPWAALYVGGSAGVITGTNQMALRVETTCSSSATTSFCVAQLVFWSQNAAYTMTSGYGLKIDPPNVRNTVVTTMYGTYIGNQGVSGKVTNAYGLYIANQSGAASDNGNIIMGDTGVGLTAVSTQLALSATVGFFWIPSMAGAPSANPARAGNPTGGGRVAMVYDSAANRIWINVGGTTWRYVQMT